MPDNRRDGIGEQIAPRRGLFRTAAARFGLGAPISDAERQALFAAAGAGSQGDPFAAFSQSFRQQEQDRLAAEELTRNRAIEDQELAQSTHLNNLRAQTAEQGLQTAPLRPIGDQGDFMNILTGEIVSPPDELRATLARQQQLRTAAPSQQGEELVGPGGEVFTSSFDPNSGRTSFFNASGERVNELPEGTTFRTLSGRKAFDQADFKALGQAQDAAADAFARIDQLERFRGLIADNTEALGPEGHKALGRTITRLTGIEINGLDTAEESELRQIVADKALEAAERLAGQGQVTEAERKLLRETIPSMDTDPKAAQRVIDIMLRAERRNIQLVEEFESAPPEERGSFRSFRRKFQGRASSNESPSIVDGAEVETIHFRKVK